MERRTNRKRAGLILSLCLAALLLLSGCGGGELPAGGGDEDSLQVVTTIFPIYDWTANILGENPGNVELVQMLDNGVDLHSYQPTAEDMARLSTCDLFIYVGGESDQWVKDALKDALNPDMVVIDLLDVLGDQAKEEETVEGMESEAEDLLNEEGPEYDEHVWLSVKNAETLVQCINGELQELDPGNAGVYQANTEAYLAKLAALDAEYQAAVDSAEVKTLLFGDRFPFRYLTDDYGLEYYAAFAGCSAETEASFETVSFLAGEVDELGLKTVLTIDGSDRRIAETIVKSSKSRDAVIRVLDSMQTATAEDVAAGKTYLSAMTENLAVLKEALR